MLVDAPPLLLLDVEDEQDVLEWRFDQLLRSGYAEDDAAELAARADVDLRVAERLLEQNCPRELALRILR